MDGVENYLTKIGSISPHQRNRGNISAVLREINPDDLLESLRTHGLIESIITDSYGRGVILPQNGFNVPAGTEVLAVTMAGGYAPALHDHTDKTAGAHLLVLSGHLYNIDYRLRAGNLGVGQVLCHSAIQEARVGEIFFVPGGRKGIHRVVNMAKEEAITLNLYWGNKSDVVISDAYVFDYGLGDGRRVTTSGPAFYFCDGDETQVGLKADALVKLEDLVFQDFQLRTCADAGKLAPEREALLAELSEIMQSPTFRAIYASAQKIAGQLVAAAEMKDGGNSAVAQRYFADLFERARNMAAGYEVDLGRDGEVGRFF